MQIFYYILCFWYCHGQWKLRKTLPNKKKRWLKCRCKVIQMHILSCLITHAKWEPKVITLHNWNYMRDSGNRLSTYACVDLLNYDITMWEQILEIITGNFNAFFPLCRVIDSWDWYAVILQGWDKRNTKWGDGNAETAQTSALFALPFPPGIYSARCITPCWR